MAESRPSKPLVAGSSPVSRFGYLNDQAAKQRANSG